MVISTGGSEGTHTNGHFDWRFRRNSYQWSFRLEVPKELIPMVISTGGSEGTGTEKSRISRAPGTINIRTGEAGPDKKLLHIVTAFVVLVNIQPLGLFFFRHAEPHHKVNDLQENKG